MMVLISVIQPVQSGLQAQDFFLRLIVNGAKDQIGQDAIDHKVSQLSK